MKYDYRPYLLVGLLLCGLSAYAQRPVYTCDFEDAAERGQWVLNKAKDQQTEQSLENKWFIGQPGHFAPTGTNGLYISSETDGAHAVYTANTTMFVAAAREMPADLPEGQYNLYFDWQCNGKANTGEGLYVCWVPADRNTFGASGVAGRPQWITDYQIGETLYANKGTWNVGKATIQHDGTPHKLVFMWFCAKGNVVPPSACVDNIELRPVPETECPVPTKISHTITNDSVILTWRGDAERYDIKCYDYAADRWHVFTDLSTRSCTIPNVEEGMQTFIFRAHCNDTTASDYVQYTQFIYHKGKRCIDYMDLTDRNCYTGPYANPFAARGKVDFGYDNISSRHTLHYAPNEYDPRTNSQLRTYPEGYICSVRLGWVGNGTEGSGNGQAHGVEFTYKITDETTSILKIKYAMVLTLPHDSIKQNPTFELDVRHNGKRIENSCGYVKYYAGDGGAANGWREGANINSLQWVWHDWTEFAINLRDYVGQTLTVRLATTDCEPSAHAGYTYFVLDCESGEMSGLNCGEDNPTTTFQAPDGFDYVWYPAANPMDTIGREQTFEIAPMDTTVYNVNVINKNNHDCWYTLTACGMPRIPKPVLKSSDAQAIRCENVVTFRHDSHVLRQNMENHTFYRSDEPITSLTWDFGDGTVIQSLNKEIKHTYPNTGGHYDLILTAGISGDACTVSDTIPIDLPDLSSPTTQLDEHACRGDYPFGYYYGGTTFYENADSVFTFISTRTGCDSLCHLRLTFHDPGPYPVADTICEGQTYAFFDRLLTTTTALDTTVAGTWGCDSIVSLSLFVDPTLRIDLPDTVRLCPEDELLHIPYAIQDGRMEAVALHFSKEVAEAGFDTLYTFSVGEPIVIDLPRDLPPNRYPARLGYLTPRCEASADSVCIEIGYSASIIHQNSGILALTNADYNGGYTFTTYQWYRDGEPIAGANSPHLAMTDADLGHSYAIEVVRESDGVRLRTCPVIYGTTALPQTTIQDNDFPLQIYSVLGIHLGECTDAAQLHTLPTGIYLLSNERKTFKIIR